MQASVAGFLLVVLHAVDGVQRADVEAAENLRALVHPQLELRQRGRHNHRTMLSEHAE